MGKGAPYKKSQNKIEIDYEQKMSHNLNYRYILLAVIMFCAFIFRFSTVFWGTQFYNEHNYGFHPDEPKITSRVYSFPKYYFEQTDLRYPTLLHNGIGILWGTMRSFLGTYDVIHGNPPRITSQHAILFSRLIVVLLGLLSVWITFKFAENLFNFQTGLIAAALLNLPYYHILNSSVTTTDVPSSFFVILSFYLFLLYSRKESVDWKAGLPLGIIVGAAISTKYTLAVLLLLPGLLPLYAFYKKRMNLNEVIYFYLFAGFWIFLIFVISTPGVYFKSSDFIGSLLSEYNGKYKPFFVTYLWTKLPDIIQGLSLLVTILVPIGIIFCLLKRRSFVLYTLLLVVGVYIFQLLPSMIGRYTIAIAPLLTTLGAVALAEILPLKSKAIPHLGIYIVIYVIIAGHMYSGFLCYQRYAGDTRYKLQQFIVENIPENSTIGTKAIWNYSRAAHGWSWGMMPPGWNYRDINDQSQPAWVILCSKYYGHVRRALRDKSFLYNEQQWKGRGVPNEKALLFYNDLLNNNGQKFGYRLISEIKAHSYPIEFKGDDFLIYQKAD